MNRTVQHGSSMSSGCARSNSEQTRKENTAAVVLSCVLFAGLAFAVGCGGSSSTKTTGTHPATYTFSVLHNFTGQPDGGNPGGGVVVDAAGNLYGTTPFGGASGNGTVFKVDPTGKETVLYSFTGGTDGGNPSVQGKLLLDAAGNVYGTTFSGGACCGTVFKLDTTGAETVLYRFTGGADGGFPVAGLVSDAAGNLYSVTLNGGLINSTCTFGCGVVFKLDPTGTETVLYTFTEGADGGYPQGDLIRDTAGNLYDTASSGGSSTCNVGNCGLVFKIDPSGTETVLHTFTDTPDGAVPSAGLIQDATGNLYGTTFSGGASGQGTVFKLDTTGSETVLYSFAGGADGAGPFGGVVQDAAGNFYATAGSGGATGNGVVFKLDTTGKETVLYSFTGGVDGTLPEAGLFQDAAGNLYGTTIKGGTAGGCGGIGCGVVFKLTLVP